MRRREKRREQRRGRDEKSRAESREESRDQSSDQSRERSREKPAEFRAMNVEMREPELAGGTLSARGNDCHTRAKGADKSAHLAPLTPLIDRKRAARNSAPRNKGREQENAYKKVLYMQPFLPVSLILIVSG